MTDVFTNSDDQLCGDVKLEVPKFKLRTSLINRIMSQLYQDGHDELLKVIRTILHRADLVSISWEQYAPYFNDGNACIFAYQGESTIEITTTSGVFGYQRGLLSSVASDTLISAIDDLLKVVTPEILKILGEDYRITIYEDRISRDEVEHD